MKDEVIARTTGGIRAITLNRPEHLNAMNRGLLRALLAELTHLDGIRAVVLQGAGRAFCAGEDLKETLAPNTGGAEELRSGLEMLQDLTRLIVSFDGAVIAAVHGYAVGGGAELALAADVVVAHPQTQFRFPETAIGHAVTGGITGRLPTLIGLARAKHLLMTSRWIGAEEAYRIGMIAELSEDPAQQALEIAAKIAGYPPRSVTSAKRGLELGAQADLERQLRWEIESAMNCFATPEAARIFQEFGKKPQTKREPRHIG